MKKTTETKRCSQDSAGDHPRWKVVPWDKFFPVQDGRYLVDADHIATWRCIDCLNLVRRYCTKFRIVVLWTTGPIPKKCRLSNAECRMSNAE